MQVGMMKQVRAPSVKHGEKAGLGAQVLGISGDGEQGLRRGPEQDATSSAPTNGIATGSTARCFSRTALNTFEFKQTTLK